MPWAAVAIVVGGIYQSYMSGKASRRESRATKRAMEQEERAAKRQRIDWLNQNAMDEWNLALDRDLKQYNARVGQELTGAELGARYGFPGRTYGGQVVQQPTPQPKPKPIPNPYLDSGGY